MNLLYDSGTIALGTLQVFVSYILAHFSHVVSLSSQNILDEENTSLAASLDCVFSRKWCVYSCTLEAILGEASWYFLFGVTCEHCSTTCEYLWSLLLGWCCVAVFPDTCDHFRSIPTCSTPTGIISLAIAWLPSLFAWSSCTCHTCVLLHMANPKCLLVIRDRCIRAWGSICVTEKLTCQIETRKENTKEKIETHIFGRKKWQ